MKKIFILLVFVILFSFSCGSPKITNEDLLILETQLKNTELRLADVVTLFEENVKRQNENIQQIRLQSGILNTEALPGGVKDFMKRFDIFEEQNNKSLEELKGILEN